VPLRAKAEKRCKVCGVQFTAWSAAQRLNRFCGPQCAAKWGQAKRDQQRAKVSRDDLRARREALKTKGDYVKEAQAAFNSYIRERDYGKPCISCGSFETSNGLTGGSRDAGHYRSRGAAPHLRFHVLNCHSQCKKCNRQLSGNAAEMRKGVALRIGLDRLIELESDDTPRQYTIEDLKRIKRIFNKRARLYKKRREHRHECGSTRVAGSGEA